MDDLRGAGTTELSEPTKGRVFTWLERAALAAGLVGSAAACLASFGWRLFRESAFYTAWSAAPFALFALSSFTVHRLISSRALQPLTALLAVAVAAQCLNAYAGAALHPNHSSGMVFAVLPLCWMIAVPVVFACVAAGFLIAGRRRR